MKIRTGKHWILRPHGGSHSGTPTVRSHPLRALQKDNFSVLETAFGF